MRKRIIDDEQSAEEILNEVRWLDLEELADVEITSEDPAHPIEGALLPEMSSGWQAAAPGVQRVRLRFATPLALTRIFLEFQEEEAERSQEFVLRWSADEGHSWTEIVRQQFTFSPTGATREVEDFRVELSGVRLLELEVNPDRGVGRARASLQRLRLA
ncbi:hypothetical protein SAMN05660860_02365 [Geoalkalibacter ferrihydriticus]|uniref:Carbohydrate-binding protein n=2 Tax=Geoalkalibacter ferrihydriticus TaxID=392333 RepID=A0A0C2HT37_9BACT|nr:hypothetical protein [Geoalkalibacter ferrihydriticus]KIH77975.1 hypothetical protein GFER_05050 [Geoalkalibacter ferrihydriticus DSM 17813]SDM34606.1 hypothetical protein SAMN05660860_02365 [Geoalkalibacter ferrihydriticus]